MSVFCRHDWVPDGVTEGLFYHVHFTCSKCFGSKSGNTEFWYYSGARKALERFQNARRPPEYRMNRERE